MKNKKCKSTVKSLAKLVHHKTKPSPNPNPSPSKPIMLCPDTPLCSDGSDTEPVNSSQINPIYYPLYDSDDDVMESSDDNDYYDTNRRTSKQYYSTKEVVLETPRKCRPINYSLNVTPNLRPNLRSIEEQLRAAPSPPPLNGENYSTFLGDDLYTYSYSLSEPVLNIIVATRHVNIGYNDYHKQIVVSDESYRYMDLLGEEVCMIEVIAQLQREESSASSSVY